MKKDAPLVTARDADDIAIRCGATAPFRIEKLRSVSYNSKAAEFTIETPVGAFDCDLFKPKDREPFVASRSIRAKYDGAWHRTVRLDPEFAVRVRDAVLEQLGSEIPYPSPSVDDA